MQEMCVQGLLTAIICNAMPFKKGTSGNPKGRATGAANKTNRDLREIVRALVEDNAEQVRQDLAALDPKDRLNAWLKLTEFVLPKLQRTETVYDFSTLPADEIDRLFDRAVGAHQSDSQ